MTTSPPLALSSRSASQYNVPEDVTSVGFMGCSCRPRTRPRVVQTRVTNDDFRVDFDEWGDSFIDSPARRSIRATEREAPTEYLSDEAKRMLHHEAQRLSRRLTDPQVSPLPVLDRLSELLNGSSSVELRGQVSSVMLASGCTYCLIQTLEHKDPRARRGAVSLLCLLSADESNAEASVVRESITRLDGASSLVSLLERDGDAETQLQALRALSALAHDPSVSRRLRDGGAKSLLARLAQPPLLPEPPSADNAPPQADEQSAVRAAVRAAASGCLFIMRAALDAVDPSFSPPVAAEEVTPPRRAPRALSSNEAFEALDRLDAANARNLSPSPARPSPPPTPPSPPWTPPPPPTAGISVLAAAPIATPPRPSRPNVPMPSPERALQVRDRVRRAKQPRTPEKAR